MKYFLSLVTVFFMALFLNCTLSMAMTTSGEFSKSPKGQDQLTGYFGGIRSGGILELRMSDKGHPRFIRISLPMYVYLNGSQVDIRSIPLLTPLKVYKEDGRVSSVEVMGGTP